MPAALHGSRHCRVRKSSGDRLYILNVSVPTCRVRQADSGVLDALQAASARLQVLAARQRRGGSEDGIYSSARFKRTALRSWASSRMLHLPTSNASGITPFSLATAMSTGRKVGNACSRASLPKLVQVILSSVRPLQILRSDTVMSLTVAGRGCGVPPSRW